jgi:hypothetical protein
MKMRRYRLSDIPAIVDAMEGFCAEHPFYSKLTFSRKKLEYTLNHNLTNTLFFCNLMVNDKDEPIAGLGARLNGYAMSEELSAEDIVGFVLPSQRTGSAICTLVEAYKVWCKDRGVRFPRISYTGSKVNGFTKLMEKNGFTPLGALYVAEV